MPGYVSLFESGELRRRAEAALAGLMECRLCPRRCEAHRDRDAPGSCGVARRAIVSSYFAHRGEEDCLRGHRGSGTIFFSGCNLQCRFCQNHRLSWSMEGEETTDDQLASMMLHLQSQGCHNINLVTPSHVVPQILEALIRAADSGLRLPLVFNTSGYDRVETLRLLDGVVDIYMPDLKFADDEVGASLTRVRDYASTARRAVLEMHRQVGDLVLDDRGIAVRGLLVRHLVLPDGLAGSKEAMEFLAREVSAHTYVNLMSQYYPAGPAILDRALSRRISLREFDRARRWAAEAGLYRFDGDARLDARGTSIFNGGRT